MLCGVFWHGWLKKASQVIVPCASGGNCSWSRPDERRILHSDLKRPRSAMYGHSSLPLMVLGLAVMGLPNCLSTRLLCRRLRALKSWRDWRINWHLYAAFRRDCEHLAGVIADQTSQASFDASGASTTPSMHILKYLIKLPGAHCVCRSGVDDLAVSGAEIQKPPLALES